MFSTEKFKFSHTESTPDEYPQKLAEFILETSYPSRRIIRQTDNSSNGPVIIYVGGGEEIMG